MSLKPYFSEKYYQRSHKALTTALESVPAYRSWRMIDPGNGRTIDERYSALPELTKQDIREHFPHDLVPDNRDVAKGLEQGEIEYVETSGTTSEKVTNVWHQEWWDMSEASSWKLNIHTAHLNHNHREAQLASSLSVGFRSDADIPMHSRILNDRLLFLNEKISPQQWNSYHFKRIIRELNEFKPAILEANPSYLARFACWAIDNNARVYLPDVILFTYELPSALQIKSIRKIFPVPFASSYGTTETGYVFMQCEHGTFHQNTDFCRVDFEPLKDKHGGHYVGRILVTIFNNKWTSLLRFDVGDLVRLSEDGFCPCGRSEGFMLSAIEGRVANATFTTSGRLVTNKEVDDIFVKVNGIRDYKVEQNSPTQYNIKIVSNCDKNTAEKDTMQTMQLLYGINAEVKIFHCTDIEPEASGKYRRTKTNFTFDEKELFA